MITEGALINAADYEMHVAAYGMEDEALVWIDREVKTMCYATRNTTEHVTAKDMTAGAQ
jgi:hypothetical protein